MQSIEPSLILWQEYIYIRSGPRMKRFILITQRFYYISKYTVMYNLSFFTKFIKENSSLLLFPTKRIPFPLFFFELESLDEIAFHYWETKAITPNLKSEKNLIQIIIMLIFFIILLKIYYK